MVYISNRGHDSVAIATLNPETGAVKVDKWVQALISFPRGMTLSPDAKTLVVANQQGEHGDTVVAFAVAADGARLTVAGEPVRVASPTDILFPRA